MFSRLFTDRRPRVEKGGAAERRALEGRVAAINRSQAVIEFDLDGTILWANANFLAVMGYELDEIVGRRHRMFVDPVEAQGGPYADFWAELNRGEFIARKFRRLAKGGREVWIQASYNPVLDQTGRPVSIVKFATDITAVENERAAFARRQAEIADSQAQVVDELADGLRRLARGELAVDLATPFASEYERLREDFNAAARKLQAALTGVAQKALAIRAGAAEISAASDDLSRRTEQQAARLEEAATQLDVLTTTVQETARNAVQSRGAVETAQEEALASGKVVSRAIQAMGEIDRSSSEIGQIIGVIDEIAFQTNLLALNAGVEAARAGDAGRGFAVVASEVRALAQRSAGAAKEIKTLIAASDRQVRDGVTLVGDAGKALETIVQQVLNINGLIVQIAAASQQQASGLAEVNSAVAAMDQATQQNAAMVEETTAAARGLDHDTAELAELVGRFDVAAAQPASRRGGGRIGGVLAA